MAKAGETGQMDGGVYAKVPRKSSKDGCFVKDGCFRIIILRQSRLKSLRFGKMGSQFFQNSELNVGFRYSGRNFRDRGNHLPHPVEKPLQTLKHGDGRKCGTAEVVNQPQGLQAVKPDMELTSEMFGIRAVPADDRPIDREPGKIEIRLQIGMDLLGRRSGWLPNPCPDRPPSRQAIPGGSRIFGDHRGGIHPFRRS